MRGELSQPVRQTPVLLVHQPAERVRLVDVRRVQQSRAVGDRVDLVDLVALRQSVEQLDPFRTGGSRCAVLVTTRLPDELPDDAHRVLVDQMTPDQARQMITGEDFTLPKDTVEDLIRATGQWPLLLWLDRRVHIPRYRPVGWALIVAPVILVAVMSGTPLVASTGIAAGLLLLGTAVVGFHDLTGVKRAAEHANSKEVVFAASAGAQL